ncbi:MAG: hypothetical protein AAFQ09_00535 [Pseudomonadota bacterium]
MRQYLISLFWALAVFLSGATATPAQTEQCSISLAGFATDRLPDQLSVALGDCSPHWEGVLSTTGVPARVTASTAASLPDAYLDAVVTALQETDQVTTTLATGPVNPGRAVEIIVAGPGTISADDFGETLSRGEVCHIILLETSWARADWAAEIGPTVAHEFFHCIQAAMATNTYLAFPTWAIEGSARWFEHHVYSGVPHAYVDLFENNVSSIPFNTLDDEAWVFFAWLAMTRGADGIIPYLQGLPGISETIEGVIDALTPEQWADFAIAYAERDIFTRDRRRVQPNEVAPVHEVRIPSDTDAQDVTIPRGRSQLMRHYVTLPAGVWRIRGQGGTVARWSQLDEGGRTLGPWRDMAAGFDTAVECQNETTFMVTGFSDSNDNYEYSISFVEETCGLACGKVPRRTDQCVVGRWEVANAGGDFENSLFINMMRGFALLGGGTVDQVEIHSETYSFATDGTFSSNRPMTMSGSRNDGINDFEISMDVRINEDRGRWGVNGRQMTLCTERNIFEATVSGAVVGEGGGTEDFRTDELVTDEDAVAARYSCEGDRLAIRPGTSFFFTDDPIVLNRLPAR